MFTNTELYKHAERELNLLLEDERQRNMSRSIDDLDNEFKAFGNKTPQEFINEEVLKVISVIDPSIHSTRSILHTLDLVYRLVQLENLLPLTLEDDEFVEVADDSGDTLYQNLRNIKVFKNNKKGIYHLDGREALDLSTGNYGINPEAEEIESDN